jgi:hypothetical protein
VLGNFQKIGEVGEVRSTKLHLERLYPAGARLRGEQEPRLAYCPAESTTLGVCLRVCATS